MTKNVKNCVQIEATFTAYHNIDCSLQSQLTEVAYFLPYDVDIGHWLTLQLPFGRQKRTYDLRNVALTVKSKYDIPPWLQALTAEAATWG